LVEVGGGDPGRRLRWQAELQLVDQELEFGLGMGVAGEPDLATVGGRQMNIDHLNGGELFERAARSEPGRQSMKPTGQRDLHAISQERDKDVSFDPLFVLMEDRTDRQVAFEIAERLFDGDELRVVLP
jgi:hypothetical protein